MVRAFNDQREVAQSVKFNARELAKFNQISLRQLQRDFRHQLGRSPQDWLNEQRILAAQQGLRRATRSKKWPWTWATNKLPTSAANSKI